jgi:hypothetical protein
MDICDVWLNADLISLQKRHDSTDFFGVECLFSLMILCGIYFCELCFCWRSVWSRCLIRQYQDFCLWTYRGSWSWFFERRHFSPSLRELPFCDHWWQRQHCFCFLPKFCLQISEVQRRVCRRFCVICVWAAFFVNGSIVEMWFRCWTEKLIYTFWLIVFQESSIL